MKIKRNGQTIELSGKELEQAYREKLHKYRLQDAEMQFYQYIGVNPYETDENGEFLCVGENQKFTDAYGFSFDEAVNPDSEHYLLEDFVREYEHIFDCNCAENDMWQAACENVLNEIASTENYFLSRLTFEDIKNNLFPEKKGNSDDSFTYEDAKADIVAYLKGQDNCFFKENKTTREAVLGNEDLLNKIAEEHYHCVTRFGNDREWSCEDACKHEPGIIG